MNIGYSIRADVLYLTLEVTEQYCAYVEIGNGIVLRINEKDGRIVGITIRDFLRHIKNGDDLTIPGLEKGFPLDDILQACGLSD